MADMHDNRATVTLGGREYALVASKLAERIYGDRFRDDVGSLGESGVYRDVPQLVTVTDQEGNTVFSEAGIPKVETTYESVQLVYKGRLKYDVAVSAGLDVSLAATGDIPQQVVAAAWAMARAAGSTGLGYDEWLAWWLASPSYADEDRDLWEAVCVDLVERAFFRKPARPEDAAESDDAEETE